MERSYGLYIKINRVLGVLVVVFGLYIGLNPLMPEVSFWVRHNVAWVKVLSMFGVRDHAPVTLITPRVSMAAAGQLATVVVPVPDENTLLIPDIDVNAPIVEGETSRVLERGIWRRPKTSTPDAGGNTVLVGHRFLYTSGPRTFYHLDKLTTGSRIILYWNKIRYEYIVDSVVVTSPDAIEIEQPTSQPTLTLYTCTPLFTVDKRLVVRAHLAPSPL